MYKPSLPPPDKAARAHSERLCAVIGDEIKQQGGVIGFDRFMALALYAPGLGYYLSGLQRVGRDGDYITAPEVSTLFSECLAVQCKQALAAMTDGSILELGAGSGVMARDMLLALERQGQLPACYYILEVSADFRQRQQQLLRQDIPQLMPRIRWLERLPGQPIKGVIIANEVLDAIPVKRIKLQGAIINELCVEHTGGRFGWRAVPADDTLWRQLSTALEEIRDVLPHDYITEINTNQAAWINSLADSLAAGLILLIDYGYSRTEFYHPQRTGGVLLCHYRHRAHDDPFYYPGLQDISASVDFTAVADSAGPAGLAVSGYTTQADFLAACGLAQIMAAKARDSETDLLNLSAQAKQLILPTAMGERFKVIALNKKFNNPLLGFSFNNQLQRL